MTPDSSAPLPSVADASSDRLHQSDESQDDSASDSQQQQQQQKHHSADETPPSLSNHHLKSEFPIQDHIRPLSVSPAPSARLSPVPHGIYNPLGASLAEGRPAMPLQRFWARNKGAILVAASQLFMSLMNLSARFLEIEEGGMHPVQVLFLRQSITAACSFLYMWWKKVPHQPWGQREIRWLLVVRGIAGFFGIMGMWCSMLYLPLADATVITFLSPAVAGILCYFVLREPYTRMEQLATLVALLGVVLIARPSALFSRSGEDDSSGGHEPSAGEDENRLPGLDHQVTSEERLIAVGVGLIGVLGGSGAFTTLRCLGKRAHPIISVNFFGVACTLITSIILVAAPLLDISQPALKWVSPTTARQWFFLLTLGLEGFVAQILLTAGLSADSSNRANSMVYTHMLFAASFDRWIFGHRMSMLSFAGCSLILGSAIGVVVMKQKKQTPPKVEDAERQANVVGEAEDSSMLDHVQLERLR